MTARASLLMPSECVVETALRMWITTEHVTMSTTASVRLMRAAFATVRARFMPAAAPRFRPVIATAMETSSMPSACAVETALRMRMTTEHVTTSTAASARMTHAAFAMVRARFMPAAAPRFRMVIATAMETSSTPSAFAEVHAQLMWTEMAPATMSTHV